MWRITCLGMICSCSKHWGQDHTGFSDELDSRHRDHLTFQRLAISFKCQPKWPTINLQMAYHKPNLNAAETNSECDFLEDSKAGRHCNLSDFFPGISLCFSVKHHKTTRFCKVNRSMSFSHRQGTRDLAINPCSFAVSQEIPWGESTAARRPSLFGRPSLVADRCCSLFADLLFQSDLCNSVTIRRCSVYQKSIKSFKLSGYVQYKKTSRDRGARPE